MSDEVMDVVQEEQVIEAQEPQESEVAREEAPESKPPSKFWGKFETEDQARSAYEKMEGFVQTLAQQRQQQEALARSQAEAEYERVKSLPPSQRPMSADDRKFLEQYSTAITNKRYTDALLLLKENIEAKTIANASVIASDAARRELEAATAPYRSRNELLKNEHLKDLHAVADPTVFLGEELGKLGHKKTFVAELVRTIGKGWADANVKSKKNMAWDEPSSSSWAEVDGKTFDKMTEDFWDDRLGVKK